VTGAGHPGARLLEGAIWVTRHQVTNQSLVQALRQELDASEAEQAGGA
jgi:predicted nucleic acid-binding protein